MRDEPRPAKFEACQIMRALNCFVVDILFDVPLSIPDRSLVISVVCEIARIEMPRAIFLSKENIFSAIRLGRFEKNRDNSVRQ